MKYTGWRTSLNLLINSVMVDKDWLGSLPLNQMGTFRCICVHFGFQGKLYRPCNGANLTNWPVSVFFEKPASTGHRGCEQSPKFCQLQSCVRPQAQRR